MTLEQFMKMLQECPKTDAFRFGNNVFLQKFEIEIDMSKEDFIFVKPKTYQVKAETLKELIADVDPFEFKPEFFNTWVELIKNHVGAKNGN